MNRSSCPKILILGATGLLGHKLWQRLSARFAEVSCAVRGSRSSLARFGLYESDRVIEHVDLGDFGGVEALLNRVRPDVVINCSGITKRRELPGNPAASILINALLPHRLADWCAAIGARLIIFSTDCVFDGREGGYTEDSPTTAEDLYGRTKALGEVRRKNVLTLRSSFIGRELAAGTELLEWFLDQRGKSIRGFRNALYTGVSTLHLAQLTGDIIEHWPALDGLYQIASEVISKYDLLRLARDAFRIDVDIEPDDSVIVRRNLDGTRFARATGYEQPAWAAMMAQIAEDTTAYDAFHARTAP